MGQHCRESVSSLRANVESLHKDRFIAQDTKETSVHSPRDLGVPLGAPPGSAGSLPLDIAATGSAQAKQGIYGMVFIPLA